MDCVSLLSTLSGLPKQRIKDAMTKGAVILKRKQGKRLRRAKETLWTGDRLSLHYDDQILALTPPSGSYCLKHLKSYSVWFKAAGIMSQGTAFGDHLAITRIAEVALNRPIFLVHRLDRETAGILLLAHTKATATKLSKLFELHKISKVYEASVLGKTDPQGTIEQPLDGKSATTHYRCIRFDPTTQQSHLQIHIETGRLHQIRRHLAWIDHPVIGDPRYGQGNKNREGLQLKAVELSFICPESNQRVTYRL